MARTFPSDVRNVRDSAARRCLDFIFRHVSMDTVVHEHRWCDRDDTNLFTTGSYTGQTIATPASIKRALLRASHNCSSVTFELQERA